MTQEMNKELEGFAKEFNTPEIQKIWRTVAKELSSQIIGFSYKHPNAVIDIFSIVGDKDSWISVEIAFPMIFDGMFELEKYHLAINKKTLDLTNRTTGESEPVMIKEFGRIDIRRKAQFIQTAFEEITKCAQAAREGLVHTKARLDYVVLSPK